MFSKSFKNKKLKKGNLKTFIKLEDCRVSQASNEIMLDRFYNGNVVEFPFLQ